ncbi:MAG: polyprenyl synthetase family protein [Proteobacteria bacterium]|nr:polyprenyl synthetase family protein [Pseudomonadota bacterium]MCP4915400.1 polyprenyl synthetase family protein [Pseudomonadota bacterium]
MNRIQPLHGTRRLEPRGVAADAPRTRIQPPTHAFALVAEEMRRTEETLDEVLSGTIGPVEGAARYLASAGGKRVRPLLTALGARAVGLGGDLSRLMVVGELIHLGSLLHDDVVDDAATRRGNDAAQHVYGNALVILTGDFCLAQGVLMASEHGGHACVSGLAAAVKAMAEGEVLQLQRAGDLDTTMEEYLEVIDRKSAALIAWCASVGANALGDEPLAARMERFGRTVGVAFQITDDILDYGTGDFTGKTPGTDLKERKLTLPLLYAMESNPSLKTRLQAHAPTDEEIPGLLAEVRATGALERSAAYASDLVDQGIAELSVLPDSPHKQALADLARYLAERVA